MAERLAGTAPNHLEIPAASVAPVEHEISALTHLARAAAATDDDYHRLERRTERLHLTRTDDAIVGDYADRMARVRTLCEEFG
jgi:hypothetical protein